MSSNLSQEDINYLVKLYYKQPNILYQHLFSSYHQLVEEIIPTNISKNINHFYEYVEKDKVIMHGFKCSNVGIKPPVNPVTNDILSPGEARKNILIILVLLLLMFNK